MALSPTAARPEVALPVDLLLPAFVIVLTMNALLIALAIRAVRAESRSEGAIVIRSRSGRPSPVGRPNGPRRIAMRERAPTQASTVLTTEQVARRIAPEPATAVEAVATTDRRSAAAGVPASAETPGAPLAGAVPDGTGPGPRPPTRPRTPPRRARQATAAASDAPPATSTAITRTRRTRAEGDTPASPPPARDRADATEDANGTARAKETGTDRSSRTTTGRRRRFSLPPLDEDHERVNRSIRSFFASGPDAPAAVETAPRDSRATTVAVRGWPPTTVASVAIVCPDDHERAAGDGSAGDAAATDGAGTEANAALEEARAAVERAMRNAARGTDRVQRTAPDRFRIVLSATGELAARAYLRRIRTNVEPVLETLEPPRRLAAATATALGEPVPVAIETAERRLEALVAAGRSDDIDFEPRVAGR